MIRPIAYDVRLGAKIGKNPNIGIAPATKARAYFTPRIDAKIARVTG